MKTSFPFGGWSRTIVAGLAVALLSGCESKRTPEIASPSTSTLSPASGSLATLPSESQTTPPTGSSPGLSNVEKDLKKDLGGPVIKPDADASTEQPTPPAEKSDTP